MKLVSVIIAAVLLPASGLFAQGAKPVRIPGTKCSLAAPAGFTASTTYSGFQKESTGAFIIVNEIPAPPAAVSSGFNPEAMERGGMKLISSEKTTVRDLPATLYTVVQQSNGVPYTKYLLIFGHDSSSTLVTAGYPEDAEENGDSLKLAIRQISCDSRISVDPLEAAPFTLNTAGTEFKPVKFVGGSLLYSMDGKVPTDKPVLIAGSSHGKTEISSRKAFAEARLKKLPGAEKATIRETAEITIDSLTGYEVIADGSGKDGNAALVYEVVLYTSDGKYFVIVGQANEKAEGLLETYRKIAKSFRRK